MPARRSSGCSAVWTATARTTPGWDSIVGPRDAVMTFAEATRHTAMGHERKGRSRAEKLFPADVPHGPGTIEAMGEVFDRLPDLSPASIPSAQQADDRQLLRWELFPRGVESDWAYAALDGAPDGAVVLEKTPEGWKFTRETVGGAGALAESLRVIPPRPRAEVRGAAFEQVVAPTFADSPLWAWLATLLGLAGGIAGAWAAAKGLRGAAARVSDGGGRLERLGGNVFGSVLKGLAVPCGLVLVVLGLLAGSAPLELTPTLADVRWALAEILLVVAGVWAAVSLIELAVLGVRRLAFDPDDPYVRMSTSVLRRAIRLVAGVVLTLFVVQNLFSWDLTAILGGVGLIALALSLAAKDAVANLFGGAMIFGTRPFLVGDWVSFGGKIGEIADVSLQATRIRLLTGEMWSVPSSNFVDEPVKNLSLRRYLRRVFDVRLPLDTAPEQIAEAERILHDVLTGEDVVGDGRGLGRAPAEGELRADRRVFLQPPRGLLVPDAPGRIGGPAGHRPRLVQLPRPLRRGEPGRRRTLPRRGPPARDARDDGVRGGRVGPRRRRGRGAVNRTPAPAGTIRFR